MLLKDQKIDNKNLCTRRLAPAMSARPRNSKPPEVCDPHSLAFRQMRCEMQKTKFELISEQCRSKDRESEIEDLKARLCKAEEEREAARYKMYQAQQDREMLEEKVKCLSSNLSISRAQLRASVIGNILVKEELGCVKRVASEIEERFDRVTAANQEKEEEKRQALNISEALQVENRRLRFANTELEKSLKTYDEETCDLKTQLDDLKCKIRELEDKKHTSQPAQNMTWIEKAQEQLKVSMMSRNAIFNEIQEIRGNIRVFCRIRPPKRSTNQAPFISIPNTSTGNSWKMVVKNETFTFDRVFDSSSTNKEVYEETAGVVGTVLRGSNVCILAYGQTGSGKTHTMEGTRTDPGVSAMAVQHLFRLIGERRDGKVQVHLSVMEIYNGEIKDLLVQRKKRPERLKLQVRNDSRTSDTVQVPGLVRTKARTVEEVEKLMERAKCRRTVSSTVMNKASSRSHVVFNVIVEDDSTIAKLQLVDLAGSERVNRSQVTGQGLIEARHINKSLSALGNVFAALERNDSHIPYRDASLTNLLRDSIGGQAKTLMFITVSPDGADMFESTATLQFGKRVGRIVLSHDRSEECLQRLGELENSLKDREDEIESIQQKLANEVIK